MGVPGKTVGVMFTPLSVKYIYYDTERIGGKNAKHHASSFHPKLLLKKTTLTAWRVMHVLTLWFLANDEVVR